MLFLEARYDKRNVTRQCSKLTSLTQLPEVTAYYFVMRCIELRQKILLASIKSDVKFNKTLVLRLFFEREEKSIINTYTLSEIKEILREGVSDEDLTEVITRASASEEK